MTNLQVIQAKATFQSLPQVTIDKALTDRSLVGTDSYDISSLKQIELVTADLYVELLSFPDIKEGSLAITYNKSQLKQLAIAIYRKYSDTKLIDLETQDSIEAVNLW